MKRLSLSLILISGLVLAGCSSGGNQDPLAKAGLATFGSIKARITGEKPEPIVTVVTRKLLDQTEGEVMQIIPEHSGLQDFMFLVRVQNDSYPGKIEVWKTTDNAHVILRDGVLIATKGLGGDLRSSDARAAIAGFDGQGGGGERLFVLDRLDGSAQTVAFACDMTQLGRETIQIVDQRVSTYHIREKCIFENASFDNEYWVETSGGRMRKSRQWVGPTYGYIDFVRLKN
ncbi:MAG: YjbF family lipoprotein [Sulfitobacter sp.]